MLRVEKVGAHATFRENLWAKAGPNRASIDSPEKRIMLDYQLTVLLVKVVRTTSLNIQSEYEKYTWGYTWHPLACYPFINIKLAAYHLWLYVAYLYQKSYNFVYALICYKQKCKVVSLNLAHPVCPGSFSWKSYWSSFANSWWWSFQFYKFSRKRGSRYSVDRQVEEFMESKSTSLLFLKDYPHMLPEHS